MRKPPIPTVALTLAALTAGLVLPGPRARATSPSPNPGPALGTSVDPLTIGGPDDPLRIARDRLRQARLSRVEAEAAAAEAERRFDDLDGQYRQILATLDGAAADVVAAQIRQRQLSEELFTAQETLNRRAAAAYMAGPGATWEVFLGSRTPAGYLSAREVAARTFGIDQTVVDRVTRSRGSLQAVTRRLLGRQAELRSEAGQLAVLDGRMAEDLALANEFALRAGLAVQKFRARERALQQAREEAFQRLGVLIDASKGVDQSAALALLGPNAGRGCEIPDGLKETDVHLAGLASWYGWDAAGGPTSSGAIFDPRLFTAANKQLPLGVYFRVHLQDRCAIVLLNDHGPYGMGRSFDLSLAAAQWLGYESAGVVNVTVDVLVPVLPLPGLPSPPAETPPP